jgi:hypothetical protein
MRSTAAQLYGVALVSILSALLGILCTLSGGDGFAYSMICFLGLFACFAISSLHKRVSKLESRYTGTESRDTPEEK